MIVMRKSKAGALFIAAVLNQWLVWDQRAQAGSFVPLSAQDAQELFPNDQDNFEEVLSGDQTGRFTGQFLNSFSTPNSVNVNFDAASNNTIVHFAGPSIAPDPTNYYTFGFAINAVFPAPPGPIVDPGKSDSYWTPGPLPLPGHIPTVNTATQYFTASNQVLVTLKNDPGTFTLSSVGYLVTNSPFSLTSLNRTALPPSAFLPSGIPDGTTLTSGASTSFLISGVNSGQYVTIFSDAQFVKGQSAGSPYTGLSGSWLEFQAAPEPSSWVLMAIGTITLMGGVAKRRRTRVPTAP
jgi:hypothetical protein